MGGESKYRPAETWDRRMARIRAERPHIRLAYSAPDAEPIPRGAAAHPAGEGLRR